MLSKQNLQNKKVLLSSTLGWRERPHTCRQAGLGARRTAEAGTVQGHLRAPPPPKLTQPHGFLMGEGGKPSGGSTALPAPHPPPRGISKSPSSVGACGVISDTPSSQILPTVGRGHIGNPRCPMSLSEYPSLNRGTPSELKPVHMSVTGNI